jgi:hypothetical protein
MRTRPHGPAGEVADTQKDIVAQDAHDRLACMNIGLPGKSLTRVKGLKRCHELLKLRSRERV